ncbi:hypothetical protein [Erythrobacter sp. JK5]|uniref:hypothetical protein n=1 Tax=Erythrobacter sp. JK5 TaxID=2829500 RepID=UPI001BAB9762|nr:hypothetical protein [Erythrobacter sp. JK5]QUL38090.1 hypothetical protein KDC96_01305 [Erythrobacter sp. JK5]
MYDRRFFSSKLGQAAIASIIAMVAFVAISSQFTASDAYAASIAHDPIMVELA